jgi:phosphoribosylglycinamide formyltransferase-1
MTKSLPKIAILSSGRGTNFQALAKAIRDGQLNAECCVLISDIKGAPVLDRAKELGIPSLLIEANENLKKNERQLQHEEDIIKALASFKTEWVILSGYKKIISSYLLSQFIDKKDGHSYSRVVNIHPSLLPAFPGLNSYQKAFEYGAKVTGVTVHFVNEKMDQGPIISQVAFDISKMQSVEEVENEGLKVEHQLFPKTLNWILFKKFSLQIVNNSTEGRLGVYQT